MVDKKSEEERIMVFLDGSNVYHIVKSLLPDKRQFDFNFEKLLNQIVEKRKLVRFYYYNAPLDRKKDEQNYMKQQRFFDKLKRIPKCNFILFYVECKKEE